MLLLTYSFCILLFGYEIRAYSDVGLNPREMIANHGYPSEMHHVTTADGYIITLYRIPHGIGNDGTTQRPPVLLVHGFHLCSGEFVATGPGRALAYVLADAGYDVWLANTRGTSLSRDHISIDVNVEPEKYFNFTWHEIGIYDISSSIDYILEVNGEESLYYVGHSQGTTVFLVLVSMKPEYNDKIKVASLMAPAAIVKHYPDVFMQEICKHVDQVWYLLQQFKIYEIPFIENLRGVFIRKCSGYPHNYTDSICDLAYLISPVQDKELAPIVMSNCPSTTGLRQYAHYGQLVRDGGFRQWNYGTEKNLQVYGTETPPDYNLTKIAAPLAFFYGKNDHLITVEDENTLVAMVPNVVINYLVPDDTFGHSDFVFNPEVVNLVYNQLLSVMKQSNSKFHNKSLLNL